MQPNTKRLFLLLSLVAAACDKPTPVAKPRPSAPAPPPPAAEPKAPVVVAMPAPAPVAIGMEDPFARLKQSTADSLNAGYKAARKKKYSDARDAFHAVVAAQPDHTAARFEELKAAAGEGDFAAIPALWRELLRRDYVGYAEKLERGKDLAPLRASSNWKEVQAIKTEMKAQYVASAGKGFLFVARLRPHNSPTFADYSDTAALELDQEVYQFDPGSKRIRRLTDTGGQVVAIHREGGKVMVLTAKNLKKFEGGTAFSKPEVAVLSLETLEKTAALAIDGDARAVALCFSAKGEPVATVNGSVETKALTLDATATALVQVEDGCVATLATTTARPTGVDHRRPSPEGVELSEDGLQVTGVDADKPVRSSQAIRAGSLSWSPGKKRFAYTGTIDRCAKPGLEKPASNPLFVWDATQKKAARVSADPGAYETQWLDDDHLAYEARAAGPGKLTIHDFTGGEPVTLKTPAGAGLYGVPTLPCDTASLALAH
jgi:hypothetical protein